MYRVECFNLDTGLWEILYKHLGVKNAQLYIGFLSNYHPTNLFRLVYRDK